MYLIATGHHPRTFSSFLIEIGEWFGYEVIYMGELS
ncbi:hypothetical protein SPFM8_00164 [Salmonella phage SPFM8]|nr:hypothetical protein SPFM8_00164 [Salmonella phage SPFM8]